MNMYEYIHFFFNKQNRFQFPYDQNLIAKITGENGLYVLFEKGEKFKEFDRIVRVGSHDRNGRLLKRLKDHFLSKNQRNSIFRKHIGRCFLNKNNDTYLDAWNKPFKKIEDKKKYKDVVNLEYEEKYEIQVSEFIQNNLSFCLIPFVTNIEERNNIEEGLISILAKSLLRTSSTKWLGNWHPDIRIKDSKIWNIEYLKGAELSLDSFNFLVENKYNK